MLLGESAGSGLTEATWLIRRPDGQMLQVGRLVQLVVDALDESGTRQPAAVAESVSAAFGRTLTESGLQMLMEDVLLPAGLAVDAAGSAAVPVAARANPLLALRLRMTILPARAVNVVARLLAPLFATPVVVVAVAVAVLLDVVLIKRADVIAALDEVLATPLILLALAGLFVAGALIHEIGHAAACRYGGAQPGVIGFGVYLVFPAFFTDVTASYRLGRAGRVRTDLGGLYFNVWCLIGLAAAYLGTGQGLFLFALLLMHIEMAQQLIPTVRFDGYFILADLAGVPDLFARMRPILARVVLRRAPTPAVTELRPYARRIVTGWVLTTAPILVVGTGWLLYQTPTVARRIATAIGARATSVAEAWHQVNIPVLLLDMLSIMMLALPVLGLVVLLEQIVASLIRGRHRRRPQHAHR